MIIDDINLNHLRVFEAVYRSRSMTAAAKELHLTQSGVSQHVRGLEDVLGIKLFDRVKQRLIPTYDASKLFRKSVEMLHGIEQTLSELRGGEMLFSGTVAIGMPIEFGNNIIAPLLTEFCRAHPKVKFLLKYGFASEMNQGILNGDLDFAFVDSFGLDKSIKTQNVYDETLVLCATPKFLKTKGAIRENKKYFESLEYVDYQPGEVVLKLWFDHHLGTKNVSLNVRATVIDVQGVARLIQSGLGAGILPSHLLHKLEKEGRKLFHFKGSGRPLKNQISVAYLSEKTTSPAAAGVLNWLLKSMGVQ